MVIDRVRDPSMRKWIVVDGEGAYPVFPGGGQDRRRLVRDLKQAHPFCKAVLRCTRDGQRVAPEDVLAMYVLSMKCILCHEWSDGMGVFMPSPGDFGEPEGRRRFMFYGLCEQHAMDDDESIRYAVEDKLRAVIERPYYYRYIASRAWRIFATRAKERAGYKCALCNADGDSRTLHCHHRTYANLGRESFDDVIVLCAHCHAKFHDKLVPADDGLAD